MNAFLKWHTMIAAPSLGVLLAALAGCGGGPSDLTGTVELDPYPASMNDATVTVQAFEFDPEVQDAPAKNIGTVELSSPAGSPVSFDLHLDAYDASLSHYVTASIDMTGDGNSCDDYGVRDFNTFDDATTDVNIVVVRLCDE